jgi:hypothetical protein
VSAPSFGLAQTCRKNVRSDGRAARPTPA